MEIAGVRLTHPDRVLYPQQGLTKLQLAHYYLSAADRILPHLANRPLMLLRCPEGHRQACFHQKHGRITVPDVVKRVSVAEKSGKVQAYLMVDDLPGLIGLVQIGALELHVWNAQADRIELPDQMIFDLDPDPALPWREVAQAARRLHAVLLDLGLQSWVKTTGGKGLHIAVPLARRHSWDTVKAFARSVAQRLAEAAPDRYTSTISKAGRQGKIFIDYLRNAHGATAVAPYSTRAREGAP